MPGPWACASNYLVVGGAASVFKDCSCYPQPANSLSGQPYIPRRHQALASLHRPTLTLPKPVAVNHLRIQESFAAPVFKRRKLETLAGVQGEISWNRTIRIHSKVIKAEARNHCLSHRRFPAPHHHNRRAQRVVQAIPGRRLKQSQLRQVPESLVRTLKKLLRPRRRPALIQRKKPSPVPPATALKHWAEPQKAFGVRVRTRWLKQPRRLLPGYLTMPIAWKSARLKIWFRT